MAKARVGIDVGGTFTDLVALVDGDIITAKVPSTPRDQSEGVMRSVESSRLDPSEIGVLAHGMTVATNALLERKGAKTAIVTTAGFKDVIEIGRQNRPSLYDLTVDRPPLLVPRHLRFTVPERVGRDGAIQTLDDAAVDDVAGALEDAEVEAVAVCLLFSFLHPEHEQRIGDILRQRLKGVHVSLSSEVLAEFREYERFATTVADAYLAPRLWEYLRKLADAMQDAGIPAPLVMQSSGGVVDIEDAAERAAACVLSGPAGGVVGAAFVADISGYDNLLTFDMGGTSTDVAPVVHGSVQTTTDSVIAGVPIKFPMVDVRTVSAGGGSIAWVDEGGALRVGPHSAGADPGPAAYGRGGEDVTVTDANLFLGYLGDDMELGGEMVLGRDLSEKTIGALSKELNMDVVDAALGVVRVANAEMTRALRVISVERGLDPREFVLVAFGGAGPIHACAIAEELDMVTVLIPKASGVLSALGLAISDVRRDYVRPFPASLEDADRAELERAFEDLERIGSKDLDDPRFERRADLRYKGQSFELTVDAQDLDELSKRFNAAHEQRYGYDILDEPMELVNVRVIASIPADKPEIKEPEASGSTESEARRTNFDGEWLEAPVLDRAGMGAGDEVEGPAIVELDEATCVVRPRWRGRIDDAGTLVLKRADE